MRRGGAIGELMLAERGEIAGRAPAFAIGPRRRTLPVPADGRQAQRRQHHRQARGIDVGHAAGIRTSAASPDAGSRRS